MSNDVPEDYMNPDYLKKRLRHSESASELSVATESLAL